MDKLDLLWDSFHFYSTQIALAESLHYPVLDSLSSLLKKNDNLNEKQLLFLKSFRQKNASLIHLYRKHNLSIKDLISFYHSGSYIPSEYDVSDESLYNLLKVNDGLIQEMESYQKKLDLF